MSSVFVGGSRRSSRLGAGVRTRLDRMVDRGLTVLVGDANGADRSLQSHFAECGYSDVLVYCSNNVCRNNLGNWRVRSVQTDARQGSREFYEAKDIEMARDADYGFMVWDGRSLGTLNNIRALGGQGKIVSVYVTCSRSFHDLKSASQLEEFLSIYCPDIPCEEQGSKFGSTLIGSGMRRSKSSKETKAHYG